MSSESDIREIEEKLALIDADRAKLVMQLNSLKNARPAEDSSTKPISPLLGRKTLEQTPILPEEKVALFLKLFRCRYDIYPKRWENLKTGRHGYAPVCGNEWAKPICQKLYKPKAKCTDCSFQNFLPLNEEAASAHLTGNSVIGTYAIREDDTCTFLASDFDKAAWSVDVLAYQKTARELGLDVAIERSRSGNGAHGWIFFEAPIPARIARALGTLILAKCSEINIHLSLDSYDRLFPSQDYLPNGGFGNLIALPLQKVPREKGNSCFLTDKLIPIDNQWEYLSQVRRVSIQEITSILDQWIPKTVQIKKTDGFDDVSWVKAIKSGHTSAKLIAKILKRGGSVYSLPGLHAKMYLFDDVAIVGSANLSDHSSGGGLIEAGVLLKDPHSCGLVGKLISEFQEVATPISSAKLAQLLKIKVVRNGSPRFSSKSRKIQKSQKINYWVLGIYERDATKDEDALDKGYSRHRHKKDLTDVELITKQVKEKGLQKDDLLFLVDRKKESNKSIREISRCVRIIDLEEGTKGGVTYIYYLDEHRPIKWSQASKILAKIGAPKKIGLNTFRKLREETGEALKMELDAFTK